MFSALRAVESCLGLPKLWLISVHHEQPFLVIPVPMANVVIFCMCCKTSRSHGARGRCTSSAEWRPAPPRPSKIQWSFRQALFVEQPCISALREDLVRTLLFFYIYYSKLSKDWGSSILASWPWSFKPETWEFNPFGSLPWSIPARLAKQRLLRLLQYTVSHSG